MLPYHARHIDNLSFYGKLDAIAQFNFEKLSYRKAYFIWAIGFPIGLHRFYTGNYGTGLILAAVTIFTMGFGAVFGIMDFPSIKKLVTQANDEKMKKIAKHYRLKEISQ